MLLNLEINNIAIIDKATIEFGEGLNVLTGETGAGKSIIIDAINAVLGERASKDLIRAGREKASVQAVFQVDETRLRDVLDDFGIELEDSILILSREISASGKNICRANDRIITVSQLKQIGERLIDIHGQNDNRSLLMPESHIELLDSFGGDVINKIKNNYTDVFLKYKETKSSLSRLSGNNNERERKMDLLKYQINEIKKAKLKIGEEVELEKQRLILSNSGKIVESLSTAYGLIFLADDSNKNSALDSINEAVSELSGIAKLDTKYEEIMKKLSEISLDLDDLSHEIRHERDETEFSPELLEEIGERTDLIYNLKKKYGASIYDILEYCKKIEIELDELENLEGTINRLNEELNKLDSELYALAVDLHKERLGAAKLLEDGIAHELNDLEMKNTRLSVSIEFDAPVRGETGGRYTNNGLDKVEFLISTNVGEPLKPLSKIASGGEMSRIMLAIKTILAKVDSVPTLIFDEIDTGISGKAAQKVAQKLSYISKNHQSICVTHLAQIACMADNHFLICKVSDKDSTNTQVKKLCGVGVKSEIARILGGLDISDITIKHAEEMLDNASRFKCGS